MHLAEHFPSYLRGQLIIGTRPRGESWLIIAITSDGHQLLVPCCDANACRRVVGDAFSVDHMEETLESIKLGMHVAKDGLVVGSQETLPDWLPEDLQKLAEACWSVLEARKQGPSPDQLH